MTALQAFCVRIAVVIVLALLPVVLPAQSAAGDSTAVAADSSGQGSQSLLETIQQTRPKAEWSVTFAKVLWVLVLFAIAVFVLKWLTRILEAVAERWTNMRLLIKRFIPIMRMLGWTFVLYISIVGILAPPIETLIAFTASASIALGFASQDLLKNIFGGVLILTDRPFQVGDKIQVGDHYGEVVQIGLRTVRIVTPDDSLVSIPNGEITNQSVSNSNSGESNCQVVSEFFLPAQIDVAAARRVAYRAAAVSRYVFVNKPIVIIFKNEIHQGRSMLKLRLKAYVLDIRYEFPFASEMTEIVLREFVKFGIVSAEDLNHLPAD